MRVHVCVRISAERSRMLSNRIYFFFFLFIIIKNDTRINYVYIFLKFRLI